MQEIQTKISFDEVIEFISKATDEAIADKLKDVVSQDGNFTVLSKSATEFQKKCFFTLTSLPKKRQNNINKILNIHS